MTTEQTKPLVDYSVQFATPCGNSTYDREYVRSFHNTACVLIELGATVDWAEFPGCADLSLARAKIFGNFLRSQHTHLFLVDSDMGWSYHDVVRLLLTKKDFVGAAGRKKTAKMEFAANLEGEEGKFTSIVQDDMGLVKYREVGAAFVLISRDCAQRIWDAHPELEFDSDGGVLERAVFDPLIIGEAPKRRRLSEDFAFCHRWRAIGGEIWLMPDIVLQHAGRAVWEGALIQSLQGEPTNA